MRRSYDWVDFLWYAAVACAIALLYLVFSAAANAASMPGIGCTGTLDNFHDSNGYFARCSVAFTLTTSAADMISCDGVTHSVAAVGNYLACSSEWQRGASGYSMALCGGDFGDDPTGHFVVCSMSWQGVMNRPPAVETAIDAVFSLTASGGAGGTGSSASLAFGFLPPLSLEQGAQLSTAIIVVLAVGWVFKKLMSAA